MTTAYFVFSEAHDPHEAFAPGGVVCKVCTDLGVIAQMPRATTFPQDPTPIDVPEPPIEPVEPPVSPSPQPELLAANSF